MSLTLLQNNARWLMESSQYQVSWPQNQIDYLPRYLATRLENQAKVPRYRWHLSATAQQQPFQDKDLFLNFDSTSNSDTLWRCGFFPSFCRLQSCLTFLARTWYLGWFGMDRMPDGTFSRLFQVVFSCSVGCWVRPSGRQVVLVGWLSRAKSGHQTTKLALPSQMERMERT